MVKVKICGITNLEDALISIQEGADAIGFNFYPRSSRYVKPFEVRKIVEKLPPFVTKVGVFVNEKIMEIERIIRETHLDVIQFHGDENPQDCSFFGARAIKVFRPTDNVNKIVAYSMIGTILIDATHEGEYGGTGRIFDWNLIVEFKSLKKSIILSGGLSAENVVDAIKAVKPYGVDACSQLEVAPGKKDHEKVKSFIQQAKSVTYE